VTNCSEAFPEERPSACAKTNTKTLVWVNTTYFAEGLPFMVVRILSSLYFTQLGVREAYLGYLNYLGLPWNIKFLWAPLVDAWSSKKNWQVALQALFGVLTFVLAALSFIAGSAADGSAYLTVIAVIFIVMAFVAATNDIAVDGFYMEAVSTREQQALLSGYRVLSYRLAMVFARSGLVGIVAYAAARLTHGSAYYAWSVAFVIAGAVLCALATLHAFILPNTSPENDSTSASDRGTSKAFQVFTKGFASYLQQPKVAVILVFIVLYKLGDELLFSMVTPFLIRELRITTEQYAWLAGVVGAAGTIFGAMVGGWWIKRVGLRKALWPLTLLMNLNLWLYVWLSIAKPDPTTTFGITVIAAVHGVEQMAAGLGSAALLIFLLSTCTKEFRATHYAIGSAIMSIPGTLLGGAAGGFVERYGYTSLYVWAFIAAIPGMCLIPFVPIKEEAV
jgi:PAT family beta-lactamase induction signal transducer AmpG